MKNQPKLSSAHCGFICPETGKLIREGDKCAIVGKSLYHKSSKVFDQAVDAEYKWLGV